MTLFLQKKNQKFNLISRGWSPPMLSVMHTGSEKCIIYKILLHSELYGEWICMRFLFVKWLSTSQQFRGSPKDILLHMFFTQSLNTLCGMCVVLCCLCHAKSVTPIERKRLFVWHFLYVLYIGHLLSIIYVSVL